MRSQAALWQSRGHPVTVLCVERGRWRSGRPAWFNGRGCIIVLSSLTSYLNACPEVDAAWLFGSRAEGRPRADSDVDVAVLFARHMAFEQAVFRRGTLMDELAARLGRAVDVVDVERLSPRIFASVMRGSRLLMSRDEPHRVGALARQYALWHDMEPHRRMQRDAMRAFFS